jgi:hypothetical protein
MRSLTWLLAIWLVVQAPAPEVDITGYYTQDGMKDGEFVRITRNGEVYQMLQRIAAGDWVGVAIRNGDSFAIGWQRADGANLGVSHYKIEKGEKGPVLVGGWTSMESTRILKDTLKWSRKLE